MQVDKPEAILKLCGLGPFISGEQLPDYGALGLRDVHVPQLLDLALTPTYWVTDHPHGESSSFTPIHAWFALGHLKAVQAVATLLRLAIVDDGNDADWVGTFLPEAIAEIGPSALPDIGRFLLDNEQVYPCCVAIDAVAHIGQKYPEARSVCASVLSEAINHIGIRNRELNAILALQLEKLCGKESATIIGGAFQNGYIDVSVAGGLCDFERRLEGDAGAL